MGSDDSGRKARGRDAEGEGVTDAEKIEELKLALRMAAEELRACAEVFKDWDAQEQARRWADKARRAAS